MRWKPHVRFGERAGETDRSKDRRRAPVRLHFAGHNLDLCRQRGPAGHPRAPRTHRWPARRRAPHAALPAPERW